ncbi:MAG: restriction endonuclease [Muribaculaceae bacterium]|nr:restriction endonuclease [Muribaculaceae bacterium]
MENKIYRVWGEEEYYRLSALKDDDVFLKEPITKGEQRNRPKKIYNTSMATSAAVFVFLCVILVCYLWLLPKIEDAFNKDVLVHYIYPIISLIAIAYCIYVSVYYSEHDNIIDWYENDYDKKFAFLESQRKEINRNIQLHLACKKIELEKAKRNYETKLKEEGKRQEKEYKNKLKRSECYLTSKKEFEEKDKQREKEFTFKKKELNKKVEIQEEQLKQQMWEYQEKIKLLTQKDELTKSKSPFSVSASIRADLELKVLENAEYYFRHKKHPAESSAEEVVLLRRQLIPKIASLKEMQYKYEYLLKVFPELKVYVENEDLLTELSEFSQFSDFEKDVDRAREYLSREEWENMPVDERNQLALDNYMKRNKSNWVVGAEYEMYCSYILRKKKYKVQEFGIEKGLQDLGRAIIAKKGKKTYIIQCKRWSADKLIHENVICQIYGSTLEYVIEHGEQIGNVIPVLYTTTDLSDMAKRFAEKLGVRVHVEPMGEYPMIKCNYSSDGEMIYHLPFDQQYYNTKIENGKDFYAWTVKEAVEKGFRRAFKWTGLNN